MWSENMAESIEVMNHIAEQLGPALAEGDLCAFSSLLDPNVHWGPPGDASPPCQNRDQVLSWYRRGKEAGACAEVVEVVVSDDHIIVGLEMTNSAMSSAKGSTRWQVLTVVNGQVANIAGFERRVDATLYAESS
jgi:hypothetical protein